MSAISPHQKNSVILKGNPKNSEKVKAATAIINKSCQKEVRVHSVNKFCWMLLGNCRIWCCYLVGLSLILKKQYFQR